MEFGPERTLKINSSLSTSQEKELCSLLRNHLDAFAWSYKEMKGVHPSICTHHIYIKEDCKPVKYPHRSMNPALKDIFKEELQKLLDAGFIYPISDSEWVSPLVLVPKKNGKWRIYVNYWELNKATKKDHFPFPFIDQVLDGLRAILSIFVELVHDAVEIYMDDFTPYGSNFQEALSNLGRVLDKCIEMNLSLSPEKCEFLMTEGTVLGHAISQQGLQVDPKKIAIIQRVPPPQKVGDV
eukprot:PITA_13556